MKYELDSEILQKAIDTWGVDSQVNMVIEECAELINAIVKFRRGRNEIKDVVTEIADVQIMCAQLELIVGGNTKIVEMERMRKMDRLRGRLNEKSL